MRINTGVGHTDSESAEHFSTRKCPHIVVCVLLTGFEPLVFGYRVRRSTNEPPRHPVFNGWETAASDLDLWRALVRRGQEKGNIHPAEIRNQEPEEAKKVTPLSSTTIQTDFREKQPPQAA